MLFLPQLSKVKRCLQKHALWAFFFCSSFIFSQKISTAELKVIQAISKVPLEKVFYVEVFLEQFNVATKNKAIIKR